MSDYEKLALIFGLLGLGAGSMGTLFFLLCMGKLRP